MIPRDILAASVQIIAAMSLSMSLPLTSNLAMADSGTASAIDVTHEHKACVVTKKRVSQTLKLTAGPISEWRCDFILPEFQPQDFYVLGLHGSPCTSDPDTICSNLIGWFAVRKKDGKVYQWDVAEFRLGDPL